MQFNFQLIIFLTKILYLWLILITPICYASNDEQLEFLKQLKNLSLNDLMEVETLNPESSLSGRKTQKLTETAGALFVLTQEDIRRAGITRLAEALRMIPGMNVARLNANDWAISVRGLNQRYATKMLVMIDGRTVYNPRRSQVDWNLQDLLIDDIKQIEVIRGPGASLWGSNAMNGIINITTKTAKKTQGTLVTSYFGNGEEQAIISARHGGKLKNGYYRIYGKSQQHDNFLNAQGQEQDDNWHTNQIGFRVDLDYDNDNFTFQGDIYNGSITQKVELFQPLIGEAITDIEVKGLNLLSRWQRHLTNNDFMFQAFYDHNQHDEFNYGDSRDILDLDFHHRWQLSQKHELMWGANFRYISDNINNSSVVVYNPAERQDKLYSVFIQNEFTLLPTVRLIVGSKFEHNDYSGFEVQPSIRLLWNINDRHNIWVAISRAVRTPSRADENLTVHAITPRIEIINIGNPDLPSEKLIAHELGYRFKLSKRLLFDSSIFFNNYDKLRTYELLEFRPFPPPPKRVVLRGSEMFGEVYGLELATHWQVNKDWKLVGNYSYLEADLRKSAVSTDRSSEKLSGNSPHHQIGIRSLLDLPNQMEFDTALYYVDNVASQNVEKYTRVDIRLGWQPNKNLDLSFGIRNLLDDQHLEFGTDSSGRKAHEIPRAFYTQIKYKF